MTAPLTADLPRVPAEVADARLRAVMEQADRALACGHLNAAEHADIYREVMEAVALRDSLRGAA